MAYNREWDQGKDGWSDNGQWEGGDGRNNVRGRDEDYYGEGKRRKFNDGSYDAQAYGGGSWNSGQGYQAQQVDQAHDWQQGGAPHHGGFKRKLVPSEPSPHVIFLGLDPEFTEADMQAYLASHNCEIETVTIIREKSTGLSKGFGFAQFATIDAARKFVDPFFPFVQVPPPASHGASARQAFYEALETGAPHGGRRVKIDFSQSVSPAERGKRPLNANDGTRDIGSAASPVLLFRGLDVLSGPQAITQAMKNSSGFGKEGARGMKRIILIKDKTTMQSWGFAFVEFIDTASASAALAATMSPQIHPTGFRISDKPVSASFAHPYSFQMQDPMQRDEACLVSSQNLGGQEGGWARYWDESSTVAVAEFEVQMPTQAAPQKEKKEKKKRVAEDALKPLPLEASTLPVSDKPVTLSFNKGGLSLNKSKTEGAGKSGTSAIGLALGDDDAEEDAADQQAKAAVDAKVAAARKVAPMIASKKTASNITKWNQVQEVLSHPNDSSPAQQPQPVSDVPASSTLSVPAVVSSSTELAPTDEQLNFADASGKICLLCARQFKTPEVLKRHNKESDLHKQNYADVKLREVGRGKVTASLQKAAAAATTTATASSAPQAEAQEGPKYRDRASERRVMHNQPDIPHLPPVDAGKRKGRADGPPAPPSPPPPPVAPAQDEKNVGNKLLKMMGWTEGQGLGVEGEGRVDPVQAAVFAQGVGLGASKGAEVGKYADGYAGYLQKGKDAARERYGRD